MRFYSSTYSCIGPYNENQDAVGFKTIDTQNCVACIADGVSGGNYGSEASNLAVNSFLNEAELNKSQVVNVVEKIHLKLLEVAESLNSAGSMLTTFTGFLISEDVLNGAHCGDSRAYILRGNGIKQLTEDHTEVISLLKSGKLTHEDAISYPRKHILESALGLIENPRIDHFEFTLEPNDRVILTTDGIHNLISKRRMRDLSLQSDSIEDFVAAITQEVELLGPRDNYSIVALQVS